MRLVLRERQNRALCFGCAPLVSVPRLPVWFGGLQHSEVAQHGRYGVRVADFDGAATFSFALG